ncbi:hypothetical protein LSH36_97g01014 [Paralvinella palmiformis]|uniref:Gelsolin-like domain-containing protein n=1 Tax=Paralvinella palmiformis TaxID=53620 RepID=A0AAD9K1P8_9ANNE|nr:hypothetical protein LSH36_97g01014 [Paralvinella palmiformis]
MENRATRTCSSGSEVSEEYTGLQKFKYDLHYWLGSDCTEEDTMSVFTRVLELEETLGESTVQYREVQGHETSLFLSYFKNNIRYLIGGLRSVSNQNEGRKKRLFQVKGKKNIRIAQVGRRVIRQSVTCMCGSLNQGDTFVLEVNKDIYVWIGPGSTRKEKLTGLAFARLLKEAEHGNKAHIHIVQDWNDNKQFYKALGSHDKVIKAADEHDNEDIIKKLDQQILVYK